MQLTNLSKIGLTKGEIKVYQALLEMGESTKTKLAKKSEVSPSKIYDITNRLLRKGIISSVKKHGVIHFKAADPHRLTDFIEKKEQELEQEKHVVQNLLPSLLAKYNELEEDIDIDVYRGWEGLKTAFLILEKSMHKNDVSDVFGASTGLAPKLGDIFWKQHQRRVEEKGFKVRIIFNEDMREGSPQRHEYYDNHAKHEIKYLHEETLNEFYVYKHHVLIFISLQKPIGILIKNKETVDAYRKFFKTMWKQAKS
jgi:HTH-type transcriptional regulator, sugar sensing transcriptional regulator